MLTVRGSREEEIRTYYSVLFQAWGCQHWWPARTRFEVIVGTYLTQNTAWTNVERALQNLRVLRLLTIDGIRGVPPKKLELAIRSAGYCRQKARRLKTFVAYLDEFYGGSLKRMFAQQTETLREELLALNGIGPETADSILLYAGNHPVFVVDAYTRRILDRHGILPEKAAYEQIRQLFERALSGLAPDIMQQQTAGKGRTLSTLPAGTCHTASAMSIMKRSALVQVYNEMHGLIVGVGKNYCLKSKPRCESCPLKPFLP